MHAPTLSFELPPGYEVVRSSSALLALHRAAEASLRSAGFGPETDGTLAESSLSGRRPLLEIAVGGDQFLVRRFSHGGLLRFFTRARFLDPMRPFRELVLAHALGSHGIATPEVVAARAQALRGGGFHLDLVTRRVPDTLDLGFVFSMARVGDVRTRDLRRLVVALGDLVRRLHGSGFLHADLTLNNVLANTAALAGGAPKLWIIDLDRAQALATLTDVARRRNLGRLFRFVERRDRRAGRALSRTDFARFFRGYDPEGRRWKSDWRAIAAAHGALRAVHALGWGLEGLFSRTRDPRNTAQRAPSRR